MILLFALADGISSLLHCSAVEPSTLTGFIAMRFAYNPSDDGYHTSYQRRRKSSVMTIWDGVTLCKMAVHPVTHSHKNKDAAYPKSYDLV